MASVALGCLFLMPVGAEPSLGELGQDAAKIRGLSYRKVPSAALTQQQAAAYVLRLLDKELEPGLTKTREVFLKKLGLMPAGSTFRGILGKLYASQVRGLYDPYAKKYIVVKGGQGQDSGAEAAAAMSGLDLQGMYTVHELDHAIQDQHFQIGRIAKAVSRHGDETFAVQSLIEGEATWVMMRYAMAQAGLGEDALDQAAAMAGGMTEQQVKDMGLEGMFSATEGMPQSMSGNSALAAAPLYFQDLLQEPYNQGLLFVTKLKKSGGWAAVNRAYTRRPLSSEQIYHPEKFLKGVDPPVKVTMSQLPKALGAYRKLGEDTAGEFTVRTLVKEAQASFSVSNGWGGDRFASYSDGKKSFAIWYTVWDTPQDALEFYNFMRGYLPAHSKNSQAIRERQRVKVLLDVPAEWRKRF